jgi:molybdopterin biosynthesis enzyme MoaB
LIVARGEGIEVMITTGGTGIAPRDCTPETVLALADKIVPGVMEHIRWKYGQNNPMAYLSRSVAVCMGDTLVYTLPGSVKAVEQYMSEILRTLEHLLLTLRGLKLH